MADGLKGVVYTTLIIGAIGTGGYIADRALNLGIKEKIAGALIDNPKDAAKILYNKLDKSKDVKKYQNDLSNLVVKGASYMDDTVKILTADELMKMSSPQNQESYLEAKLSLLPDDKKVQLAEKTLSRLPTDKLLSLVEKLPDSVQNSMVKYVAKERVNEFFNEIKSGMKKAYDSTFGKLGDKD